MSRFLFVLVVLVWPVGAQTSETEGAAATALPSAGEDAIYLRDVENRIGYRRITGRVDGVTSHYVLFQPKGGAQEYLYTREEVRRIELGDEASEFHPIVDRHWNQQPKWAQGDRSWWEHVLDLLAEYLPGGVLVGLILMAALYFVVSTAFQAYQRLVLEGHLKRLTTEKLVQEIEKLQVEVIELRKKLGLPAMAEAPASESAHPHRLETFGSALPSGRAVTPASRLPEIHVVAFMKRRVLGIPTAEEFEARKERFVQRWQKYEAGNAAGFKLMHSLYSLATGLAIVAGWLFVIGSVGGFAMLLSDPTFRETEGAGAAVTMLIMALALLVAVVRLTVKRRIRAAAFDELFYD